MLSQTSPLLAMIGADKPPDKEQLARVIWAGNTRFIPTHTHSQTCGKTHPSVHANTVDTYRASNKQIDVSRSQQDG